MQRLSIPLITVAAFISACSSTPKYVNPAESPSNATIVFGDRFGGDSIFSPARTFTINTTAPEANKCADYAMVGTTSNNWTRVQPKTREITVSSASDVAIKGSYFSSSGFGSTSCEPPIQMFKPLPGLTYSVDVELKQNSCRLQIAQKIESDRFEPVAISQIFPACNK